MNLKNLFLAAIMAFAIQSVSAYDIEHDGIYYKILAGRQLEATGIKYHFGRIDIPISISIDRWPYPVTAIAEGAFRNLDIKILTIGRNVSTIGKEAFAGCRMESIYFSAYSDATTSVTIGEKAFYDCNFLRSVNFKSTHVTTIGENAFGFCSGLTSITIPSSVTSIGSSAFCSCTGLTSVTIPNSVTSIGEGVFYLCSGLTSITIPNSVTSIGEGVFADCSGLTSITIPNSVTSIGEGAFSGCSSLTTIVVSVPYFKV